MREGEGLPQSIREGGCTGRIVGCVDDHRGSSAHDLQSSRRRHRSETLTDGINIQTQRPAAYECFRGGESYRSIAGLMPAKQEHIVVDAREPSQREHLTANGHRSIHNLECAALPR